ncbi:N-acetylmuramoyl-L-alanine amidase [Arenibacter sp. N53]|uniref:N-acetylmuramoyl-L-alanine amidase family protein n=1 Tax=Arenibacter TaxID=178469 RepID=UPI000CD3C236|nr:MULTISPECIES: N-acetylmuramoyl-L-alanine amidase [Arenibacter]MCM4152018.1 N-acetylmuramoyl-L-alanine amidase [Arenibacter sp. N53]|tara:strand:- start:280 stop:942 length:663 start_codon:yes stop_codon:yes gene_type:complete
MKRLWIVCLWIGFALFCNRTQAQENRRQMVILDPGHGGMDSGAIGINGIKEKDIVLEVAKEAIRLNKELFGNTLDIYLTRYKDTLISLSNRTKLVKVLQPDVFISIHCNQAARKAAQGIEVYVQQHNTSMSSELQFVSENLSEAILLEFDQALGFKIRGIKYANFQVLRETQYDSPGVLLEIGFLSNWEEAEHSRRKESVRGYAMVIIQALYQLIDAEYY